ncbi:GntR family transcriptional regulator [Gandjariella thermophila]|uniref:Putative GntR-family transcriptional regulator n=1 Tax=Gandjariella thermophila TaxID=1931992 RepID=A0A4D4J509_9PSEU|nr:GntR family transcriptional regulator [Gandjariella thermophila]GDY29067.1 putative GntR-family transcriptional regulator [Gandjariella thermophila]
MTAVRIPHDRRPRADRARQVADVLRQQVVRGAFGTGALPDERLLATEFAASRNTIREALTILRAERLIERVPSVGTLVVNQKYCHGLDRLMGLAEMLHEHGTVTNEVRVAGLLRPPRSVASRLRVPDGGSVIYVERLRRLNGSPLSLDLTYLVPDIGRPLLEQDLEHRDIFALIENVSGHRLGTAEVTVEAVNADAHSAAVLDVPEGAALLVAERLSRLDDGRPVDLEFIRFRGDRLTMRARLSRDEEGAR